MLKSDRQLSQEFVNIPPILTGISGSRYIHIKLYPPHCTSILGLKFPSSGTLGRSPAWEIPIPNRLGDPSEISGTLWGNGFSRSGL